MHELLLQRRSGARHARADNRDAAARGKALQVALYGLWDLRARDDDAADEMDQLARLEEYAEASSRARGWRQSIGRVLRDKGWQSGGTTVAFERLRSGQLVAGLVASGARAEAVALDSAEEADKARADQAMRRVCDHLLSAGVYDQVGTESRAGISATDRRAKRAVPLE